MSQPAASTAVARRAQLRPAQARAAARMLPFVPRAIPRLLLLDPELDRGSTAIAPPAGEPTPTSPLPVTTNMDRASMELAASRRRALPDAATTENGHLAPGSVPLRSDLLPPTGPLRPLVIPPPPWPPARMEQRRRSGEPL
ncbi:uncharacterized protein LOC125535186 [Triticum urartu]|uniref:uncharacterized protein LOC125535186 n=1 Tax=Triticum urartu TaxID=4572 RepID=UPI002043DD9F|nr:uncharacterized protein LOC125535186 [Triticum urartu]